MKKTIILNAGHSISDPGVLANTTTESQEVIKIRDKLSVLLKQNFEVSEVPDELGLEESIKWVNGKFDELEDGLALSIHLNSSGSGQKYGAQIYYYGGSDGSMKIAQNIINTYCNLTRFRNMGANPDTIIGDQGMSWIRKLKPWSFLIECCFLDNVDDLNKLQEEYDEVAWAIYSGICLVYNVKPIDSQQINAVNQQDSIKQDLHPIHLNRTQYYGSDSLETKLIREYIGNEFHLKRTKEPLNCTEYAYYRLLCAGIKVEWTQTTGRHGGLWPEVVSKKYKVLDYPVKGGVICLPLTVIPRTGHVAYVESVNQDESINISEANWGTSNTDIGRYWERTLSVDKWKNKYKAKFIDFM